MNRKLRALGVNKACVQELVELDREKQTNRFEAKQVGGENFYRATSGWSLSEFEPALALKPARSSQLPWYLYPATRVDLRDRISRKGLKPGTRLHCHLASDPTKTRASGSGSGLGLRV